MTSPSTAPGGQLGALSASSLLPSTGLLLAAPAVIMVAVVFALPFALLLVLSLASQAPGSLQPDLSRPTLAAYGRILGDGFYVRAIATTLLMAAASTLISLALALPLAHWLSRRAGRLRRVVTALVVAPLACGALLPTLGLVHLLGPLGVLNGTLRLAGLIDRPLPLLGTRIGIVVGLAQAFLPFALLPILAAFDRLPLAVEEAASSLGARPWRTWVRVLLPLVRSGIAAGGVLVFSASVTAFVTPQVLGQGKVATLATLAYQQAIQVLDWPFASALGVVMLGALGLVALLTKAVIGGRS